MDNVLPGQVATYETRREANDSVDKEKRYKQIEYILSRFPEGLTAKEITVQMKILGYTPTDERNFASPRLTEMTYIGRVKPLDKKRKCKYTNKMVTVYVLVGELKQMEMRDVL